MNNDIGTSSMEPSQQIFEYCIMCTESEKCVLYQQALGKLSRSVNNYAAVMMQYHLVYHMLK